MTTQKVFVSYEEILDLKTSQHHVTAVGVHTPTGNTPHKLFPGFWRQYQKVKYLGASLSLIPAARLPADISQVGFEGGQAPIDMRDLLNPILWHGCHGESMGAVLNMFMSGGIGNNDLASNLFRTPSADIYGSQSFSASNFVLGDVFEDLYYKALTDNTWAKAHPQKGFRKSGLRPLIYSMGVNRQISPVDSSTGIGPRSYDYEDDETIYDNPTRVTNMGNGLGVSNPSANGGASQYSPNVVVSPSVEGFQIGNDPNGDYTYTPLYSSGGVQFVANRLRGLGWLDTMNRYGYAVAGSAPTRTPLLGSLFGSMNENSYTQIPYLMMGLILLPPSYIAEQFFRLVIKHRFAFSKYRGFSLTSNEFLDSNRTTFNAVEAIENWESGGNYKGDDDGTERAERSGEDTTEL